MQSVLTDIKEVTTLTTAHKVEGLITVVYKLPNCSFCHKPARYDGKTLDNHWHYMCPDCFQQQGVGLGPCQGQYLAVDGEEHPDVTG